MKFKQHSGKAKVVLWWFLTLCQLHVSCGQEGATSCQQSDGTCGSQTTSDNEPKASGSSSDSSAAPPANANSTAEPDPPTAGTSRDSSGPPTKAAGSGSQTPKAAKNSNSNSNPPTKSASTSRSSQNTSPNPNTKPPESCELDDPKAKDSSTPPMRLPTYVKLDTTLPTNEVVIAGQHYELGYAEMFFDLPRDLLDLELIQIPADEELHVNESNLAYWFLGRTSSKVVNKANTRVAYLKSPGRIYGYNIPYGEYTLVIERKIEFFASLPGSFNRKTYYCMINVSETDLRIEDNALRLPETGLVPFKYKIYSERCQ